MYLLEIELTLTHLANKQAGYMQLDNTRFDVFWFSNIFNLPSERIYPQHWSVEVLFMVIISVLKG